MTVSMMGEIEALIPLLIPFIVGLISGLLIKTALKLAIGVIALAVLLSWGGYMGISSVRELFLRAQAKLPTLIETGRGWLDIFPYTAPAFIVGLVIGIWWK